MIYRILLIILISSCSSQRNQTANEIIPQEKFVSIIKDVHLIEAVYETNKYNRETKANVALQVGYDSIFNLHEITYEDFQNSLQYYSLNDNDLELIYHQALEAIKKENSKLN